MLRIKKDNVEKIVSVGSYEDLYEGLGYEIVSKSNTTRKVSSEKVDNKEPELKPEDKKPETTEDKKVNDKKGE